MSVLITGVIGTGIAFSIAWGLIFAFQYLFGIEFFLNWVGLFFMSATPFQIMLSIMWRNNIPPSRAALAQPIKGIISTLAFIAVGLIVTALLFFLPGQAVMSPILIHYTIVSIGFSLIFITLFDGWPFNQLTNKPVLVGVFTLLASYVVAYIVFTLCFNYSFFQGAPFYSAAVEPGGLFNGFYALTYIATVVSVVVMLALFDFWPVIAIVNTAKQPVFGLLGLALVMSIGTLLFYLGIYVINVDVMDFLVRVPVCLIFGAFLVDNMMQFQLFANTAQPKRGLLKLLLCVICAITMYELYSLILPMLTGTTLPAGPKSGYVKEAWLATATLGVTFPVINIVSAGFEFWPIKRAASLGEDLEENSA